MDPIGISQPVIVSAPVVPARPAQSAPSIPLPAPVAVPTQFDVQAAEKQRVAALQKAASEIANVYVLGDQSFSLFKDATGQYITRFTSLKDGKVTYIPEPTLFKMGGSNKGTMLKIQA